MRDIVLRLRSRRGYTLSEMLVVLALMAIFSLCVIAVISFALRSSATSITESHALTVSDTVNTALRDIFVNSEYVGGDENGEVLFICEKYSGWEMSLGAYGGRISANIHDELEGEQSELLLNSSAYAEFEVSDFSVSYLDGIYTCSYSLVCEDFRREVTIDITPLNKQKAPF